MAKQNTENVITENQNTDNAYTENATTENRNTENQNTENLNPFTVEDLKSGDIVTMRCQEMGVVLADIGVIILRSSGLCYLDEYTEDLRFNCSPEGRVPERDIMEVRRGALCPVGFEDRLPSVVLFQRGEEPEEECEEESFDEAFLEMLREVEARSEKDGALTIMIQAIYGNQTITQIEPENLDALILGYLDYSLPVTEPIDRSFVRIPGSEELVLVYNRYREESRLEERDRLRREENYELKPLAVIPELDLRLYSRCAALRMQEDGTLTSILPGDEEVLCRYLSR